MLNDNGGKNSETFRVAYSVFTHVNIYWTVGSKLMTILESGSNFCIIWKKKPQKHTYEKGDLTDIGYKSTRKEILSRYTSYFPSKEVIFQLQLYCFDSKV